MLTQPIAIAVDAYDIKEKKVMVTIKLTSTTGEVEEIQQDSPFFTGS